MSDLEKKLQRATSLLHIAHTLVYGSARGVEPFIRSKFLNILGKEIDQLSLELRVFMGHCEILDSLEFRFQSLTLLEKILSSEGTVDKGEPEK